MTDSKGRRPYIKLWYIREKETMAQNLIFKLLLYSCRSPLATPVYLSDLKLRMSRVFLATRGM